MSIVATQIAEPGWEAVLLNEAAAALEVSVDELELEPLTVPQGSAQSSRSLLVRGRHRRPVAALICSEPHQPDLAARGARRARQFERRLTGKSKAAVLLPVGEGRIDGLSYALYPWCRPIANRRVPRWLACRALTRPLLSWLEDVTRQTGEPLAAEERETAVVAPLKALATAAPVSHTVRLAARDALHALDRGRWTPVHVAMHGDFWYGNVLIDDNNVTGRADLPYYQRFVVIDWPGSQTRGWPLYDLMRISASLRLDSRSLAREVERHCDLLGSPVTCAPWHLALALANLAAQLNQFPIERFALVAHHLVRMLNCALEKKR